MLDKLNNIIYKIKEKITGNSTNKRVFQLFSLRIVPVGYSGILMCDT